MHSGLEFGQVMANLLSLTICDSDVEVADHCRLVASIVWIVVSISQLGHGGKIEWAEKMTGVCKTPEVLLSRGK